MRIAGKLGLVGAVVVLLFAACTSAQQATSTPTSVPRATAAPTATPPSGTVASATATPQPVSTAKPQTTAQVAPKSGGTLRYPLRTDPAVWDGQAASGGYQDTRVQYNLVHEMLFTLELPGEKSCKLEVNPELAESWKWIDDLTLEVKVHQGVKFQNKAPVNGREMTAEDVVFGLRRAFFTYPIRAIQGLADPIKDKEKGIVATDRYTVRFISSAPNPGLIQAGLSNSYGAVALPAGVWPEKDKWEDPAKYWIGTGPFQFSAWTPGVKTVVEKNPSYWQKGLPYLDRIEFVVISDSSTREAAVRSGKLDIWNWELTPMSADTLRKTAPQVILQECSPPSGFGGMYLRQDRPPFNDVRVRRAYSMAIDRDALLKTVLQGHGFIGGIWPPNHPWYLNREDLPPEIRKYLEYHPDESKKLLAEAGFPNGLTMVLATTARWGSAYTSTVEALVDMAGKAGFTVKPKFVEYSQFMAGTIARKWPDDEDVALAPISRSNPYRDALTFHTKGQAAENKGYASNAEYDKLAEQFMVTVDEAKAREILRQLQIVAADQVLWVRPPYTAANSAHQPWVKGYAFSGDAYYGSSMFRDIWFDK